ncbi:DUF4294 domain-containing protein [Ochrovirga pacifica]|uniref:DUF4294 domain-containing protein n=1 Tax=Ochrovirga pacifica TaxID=1042376 RepID=UPI00068034C1|nr:DUF4294 domain-containing protein [Ochrovirga pacifica]
MISCFLAVVLCIFEVMKKMTLCLVFTLFLLGIKWSFAQEIDFEKLRKKYEGYYVISHPDEQIILDTVVLFPQPTFKTYYDRRYYLWFAKKTYKAYPYAVLAKHKINQLNDSIQLITSKRKRKKFIKEKQDFFEEQFTEDIKKLTRTEGRILIKLIHRLTGATVNEHIQDKRGNFRAFWYRVSASLFKIKLDLEYHPESELEDFMIEAILQEAFQKGRLVREPSVLKSANYIYPQKEIHIEKKK